MALFARLILIPAILILSLHSSAQLCPSVFTKNNNFIREENVKSWSKESLSKEVVEEELGTEKAIDYIAIKTDLRKKVQEEDLFNDQSDVILGIDTTGYTKGHVYMIISNKRIDGHILFAAQTEVENTYTLSRGLFIRIKNLPEANKKRLLKWATSGNATRAATCVAVACKFLFQRAGLKGPKSYFWFPSEILGFIVEKGLIGTKKQKATIEIYTLNEKLDKIIDGLPTWLSIPKLFFMLFDRKTWGF